jgi:hypothetical protein
MFAMIHTKTNPRIPAATNRIGFKELNAYGRKRASKENETK